MKKNVEIFYKHKSSTCLECQTKKYETRVIAHARDPYRKRVSTKSRIPAICAERFFLAFGVRRSTTGKALGLLGESYLCNKIANLISKLNFYK